MNSQLLFVAVCGCSKLGSALSTWQDNVVPVAVERIGAELDGGEFLLSNFDAFRILSRIQLTLHAKAGFGCGRGNQVDDDFMTDQRLATPVLRDE